jgi:hypothetical protein
MTATQKAIVCASVAILAGVGIYEAHQAARLRNEVQRLEQQKTPLAEQIQQLARDRDDHVRQLATLRNESEGLHKEAAELLKLRAEVSALRRQVTELGGTKPQTSAENIAASQPADALEQQKRVARAKSIDGRNYAVQLISFAEANQGWLPTNWQAVAAYETNFPTSGTNEFEMVYRPPLNRQELGTNLERTVLVREYLAWPTGDGKWGKVYGFADGHSEFIKLEDGNFAAWEQSNTYNLRENAK